MSETTKEKLEEANKFYKKDKKKGTKEDIARKIADRHPEVSKKDLMTQSLATLRRILLSGKIPAMLSESGEFKMPTAKLRERIKKLYSGRQKTDGPNLKNRASGGAIRRRGGGIAKRGFGITK